MPLFILRLERSATLHKLAMVTSMARYQAIASRRKFSAPATLVISAVLLLSACQNPVPTPVPTRVAQSPTPPPTMTLQSNFAFVFEWNYCYTYSLDTFDNSLRLNTTPGNTITISLALSHQELDIIFQKMAAIDLFSYPEEFSIQFPIGMGTYMTAPSPQYRFDVRDGTQSKVVRWNDNISAGDDKLWKPEDSEPSWTQATKLRELIKLIQDIVEAHPEFDKLPSPGGCA
jgi:hypothetical protein